MNKYWFYLYALVAMSVSFLFNSCQGGFSSQKSEISQASKNSQSINETMTTLCSPIQNSTANKVFLGPSSDAQKSVSKFNINSVRNSELFSVNSESFYNLKAVIDSQCAIQGNSTHPYLKDVFDLESLSFKIKKQTLSFRLSINEDLTRFKMWTEEDPCIFRISPNRRYQLNQTGDSVSPPATFPTPNDGHYNEQLYMETLDAIEGYSWLYSSLTGWTSYNDQKITVAVLDTGADFNHPDLAEKLWTFSPDGLETYYGVDATTLHPTIPTNYNVIDLQGHGTQVAGLIAAETNNFQGIAGIAPHGVQIMPIKVTATDPDGVFYIDDQAILDGARWAADQGASVINLSIVRYSARDSEDLDKKDLLEELVNRGVTVVLATGNATTYFPRAEIDNINFSVTPAIYGKDFAGVLNVGSSVANDKSLASFSHYSNRFVEILAPGTQINAGNNTSNGLYMPVPLSLRADGLSYSYAEGTSYSAPLVAGAAAMIQGYIRERTGSLPRPCVVESFIQHSAEKVENLENYVKDGNHLNLGKLGQTLHEFYNDDSK